MIEPLIIKGGARALKRVTTFKKTTTTTRGFLSELILRGLIKVYFHEAWCVSIMIHNTPLHPRRSGKKGQASKKKRIKKKTK